MTEQRIILPSVITITLNGTPIETAEKYRENIHLLIEYGVFDIKNGSSTLHFDQDGNLRQIQADTTVWKKDKALPKLSPGIRIDMKQLNTQTQTMSGAVK